MNTRSKLAIAAVAALTLAAGFSANAQTAPNKLYLVTVDSTGCADVNAADGPIASFGRNCSAYQEAMPRDIWIPALRSKVIATLCPKVDGGERQCRDAVVVRKGKPNEQLSERLLRRTSDVQAVFLARQLGIKIPS